MDDLTKLKPGDYITDGYDWYKIIELKQHEIVTEFKWTNSAGTFVKRCYIPRIELLRSNVWKTLDD